MEEREADLKKNTNECKPTKEINDKNFGYFTAMKHVKDIVNQLAEEYNGGWITDRNPTREECKNNRFWITDSDRWSYEADFDLECERWRDLERGGFIEVIAWYILPLPAPYQPKGE